jgi:hypothetical protein
MNALRRCALPLAALGLLALWLAGGCGKLHPDLLRTNTPPDTQVRLEADRADTTSLKVHLLWTGTDPDGIVTHYETRWGTSAWTPVAVTDSTYRLPAQDPGDSAAQAATYTFSVRAVDDDRAVDPTPASVTFTARNTLPETEIIRGPSGVTGPCVHFEWRGWDYDGIVVGYAYRLYQWTGEPGDEWLEILAADTLGADDVTADFCPLAGLHRFTVWAVDDVGGSDPTPAERQFTCNPALAGPRLTVRTNVLGVHAFRGPAWSPAYDTPVPIFEGEHMVFDWTASAEDCGGSVVGYSSAFDDTSAWGDVYSLDDTHFAVTPTVGEHSLYISAKDNFGVLTRARLAVDVHEATLDEYVLIVDDYDWREHLPSWPTDEQRDAFYDTLAMGVARPTLQWDVQDHAQEPPDVETLSRASTVVWYADADNTALRGLFDPYVATYATLAGYVRVGGNLILCGTEVLRQIADDPYPLLISPSDTTAGRTFIRDQLGIGYADNSGYAANKSTPWTYGYCFYGAVPGGTGVPEGRDVQLEAMYIDSLGKWSVIYNHPHPNYNKAGLPAVEKIEAYQGAPMETHFIDAFLNMNYEDEPCIVLKPTGSNRGNVCYFGFMLYYLQTPQVQAAFDRLLELFGE